MNKSSMHRSEKIYGLLLRLYPKTYKKEFGDEMKFVFSQSLEDAYKENGGEGIIRLWIRTCIDAGKSLLIQHVENRRGGESMKTKKTDLILQNKIFAWIALATGIILSIPLIAMQFTREVNWTFSDFVIMGILLFGAGFTFVHVARVIPKKYRLVTGISFMILLLWIWAELAVGVFTNIGS